MTVAIAARRRSRSPASRRRSRSIYGKPVSLQTVLDPSVVGGIRIQIGDEVVDGTVLRRLDRVRRDLAG